MEIRIIAYSAGWARYIVAALLAGAAGRWMREDWRGACGGIANVLDGLGA